jgi:hypothetical protein
MVGELRIVILPGVCHPGNVTVNGEGPRSRCYGRTAVIRFIVQPCDEDEDDD